MNKKTLYLVILIMGCMGAVMNSANGFLASEIGLAESAFFVHFAGLIVSVLIFAVMERSREKNVIKTLKSKPYLFVGGILGAFAVVIVSIGIMEIGVFATSMALIAGQFLSSLIIDYKGFFGFEKVKFNKYKLMSVCIMIIGVVLLSI